MKQRDVPINYGNSNGLINYQDVMLTLQNEILNKHFKNIDKKKKAIEKIAHLQQLSKDEFAQWTRTREDHYEGEEKIIL
jgi:hypothetical protein